MDDRAGRRGGRGVAPVARPGQALAQATTPSWSLPSCPGSASSERSSPGGLMRSADPGSTTGGPPPARLDLIAARHEMVDTQLAARGIRDPVVLDAMRTVPREAFLPDTLAEYAYDDGPLPIGEGQTISQPYVVAFMTEAVSPRPDDRALEIGTGSGYVPSVLGPVGAEGDTVRR